VYQLVPNRIVDQPTTGDPQWLRRRPPRQIDSQGRIIAFSYLYKQRVPERVHRAVGLAGEIPLAPPVLVLFRIAQMVHVLSTRPRTKKPILPPAQIADDFHGIIYRHEII